MSRNLPLKNFTSVPETQMRATTALSGTNMRRSDALLRTAEKSDKGSSIEKRSNYKIAEPPRVKSALQIRSAANLRLKASGLDITDDKLRSEYKGMSLNEMA